MRDLDSQVAGSSYSSFSIISEPPDIRKWFSSYTYQSPVLDTNEEFADPVRVGEEERGLCVKDSEDEDEDEDEEEGLRKTRKNHQSGIRDKITRSIIRKPGEETRIRGHSPAVEVQAYPDSLSLPSEPPDIRNWFSSYVYESPALDSAEFHASLSSRHDLGNTEEVDKRRDVNLKGSTVTDLTCEPLFHKEAIPNSYATNTTSVGAEKKSNHSAGQENDDLEGSHWSPKNNLCPENSSVHSTHSSVSGKRNIILDKSDEYPIFEAENTSLVLHEGQQTSRVDDLTSPAKVPYESDCTETGEVNTESKFIVPENDSGWILPNQKSREVDCKSNKKQPKQHMFAENGYTLANNKVNPKINDENSPEHLGPRKCNYDSNVSLVSSKSNIKEGVEKREALRDKSNFQHTCVVEVAGKWRCPQRSKPDTGPPLKQLRLEKWVHRV